MELFELKEAKIVATLSGLQPAEIRVLLEGQSDESILAALVPLNRLGRQELVEFAWTVIVSRYNNKVINALKMELKDPEVAMEVMQKIWLHTNQMIIKKLAQGEQIDSFRSLFYTVVNRRKIDEIRSRSRNAGKTVSMSGMDRDGNQTDRADTYTYDQTGASAYGDPEAEAQRNENHRVLMEVLEGAPEHYRVIVHAKHFLDMDWKNIIKLLAKKNLIELSDPNVAKNVENYYYRALKWMKKELSKRQELVA